METGRNSVENGTAPVRGRVAEVTGRVHSPEEAATFWSLLSPPGTSPGASLRSRSPRPLSAPGVHCVPGVEPSHRCFRRVPIAGSVAASVAHGLGCPQALSRRRSRASRRPIGRNRRAPFSPHPRGGNHAPTAGRRQRVSPRRPYRTAERTVAACPWRSGQSVVLPVQRASDRSHRREQPAPRTRDDRRTEPLPGPS